MSALPEVPVVPEHKLALANSIRRLIEVSLFNDGSAADVLAISEGIDRMTAQLSLPARDSTLLLTRSQGGISINNAVEGPGNPIAPPVRDLRMVDGELRGSVTFGPASEGPPGLAHGGLIAAVLDHALGRVTAWAHRAAMTASLTVDYRAGTPLGVELDVRANLTEVAGRKVWASARIVHHERVLAEATALLVTVRGLPTMASEAGTASEDHSSL